MTLLSNSSKDNIDLMRKLCLDGTVLGELTFCQAILEGGLQNSPPSSLALKYNNLFGMKPGYIRAGTAKPATVWLPTKEYIHNKGMVTMNQPFLSNLRVEDSIQQHRKLLTGLSRYEGVEHATNVQDAAEALIEGGYATDPKYVNKILDIYNKYVNTED